VQQDLSDLDGQTAQYPSGSQPPTHPTGLHAETENLSHVDISLLPQTPNTHPGWERDQVDICTGFAVTRMSYCNVKQKKICEAVLVLALFPLLRSSSRAKGDGVREQKLIGAEDYKYSNGF